MKHVITFEEEDLLQFVRDMLAMRGVAPAGDIKIECEQVQTGVEETGNNDVPVYKTVHSINVRCTDRDVLTHCPMCKHALGEAKELEKPAAAVRLVAETQATPEPEEPEEPAESVVLDESLGESLEPPEPPTNAPARREGGGPSIASIRAQSERVRREREPNLPRRPRGNK